MMIEAMGNNDPLLFEINLVHFPCRIDLVLGPAML
jgi:hypothetical protein